MIIVEQLTDDVRTCQAGWEGELDGGDRGGSEAHRRPSPRLLQSLRTLQLEATVKDDLLTSVVCGPAAKRHFENMGYTEEDLKPFTRARVPRILESILNRLRMLPVGWKGEGNELLLADGESQAREAGIAHDVQQRSAQTSIQVIQPKRAAEHQRGSVVEGVSVTSHGCHALDVFDTSDQTHSVVTYDGLSGCGVYVGKPIGREGILTRGVQVQNIRRDLEGQVYTEDELEALSKSIIPIIDLLKSLGCRSCVACRGALERDHNRDASGLARVVTLSRPLMSSTAKAKTTKLIRTLLNHFDSIPKLNLMQLQALQYKLALARIDALLTEPPVRHAEDKDYTTTYSYSYFYETFENISSQDDPAALNTLKYILLCKVMFEYARRCNITPLHQARGIENMHAIALAHQNRNLADFENVLRDFKHAKQVGQGRQDVEAKLSQMILDKVFHGVLDQGGGCLIVFDDLEADVGFFCHSSFRTRSMEQQSGLWSSPEVLLEEIIMYLNTCRDGITTGAGDQDPCSCAHYQEQPAILAVPRLGVFSVDDSATWVDDQGARRLLQKQADDVEGMWLIYSVKEEPQQLRRRRQKLNLDLVQRRS
ncbi:hypothetical protein DEU56DRAFT_757091 [Suillus clintonianus]|uniref:uncharacterized protein n=1 Tax=Suillus clintonianus TaxID=1904413 RepID=UPI001B86E8E0|nr:uncharacterized protein DEU56DRAFT_757091 [Suillus clintonianus]KAG2133753.1 hypothetical protein DEU56DRAFT_757091 [Suillus clintonianus]